MDRLTRLPGPDFGRLQYGVGTAGAASADHSPTALRIDWRAQRATGASKIIAIIDMAVDLARWIQTFTEDRAPQNRADPIIFPSLNSAFCMGDGPEYSNSPPANSDGRIC